MLLHLCLLLLCAGLCLAQPACEANNVAFGTFNTGQQRSFGCSAPAGSSHDIIISNPQGRRLFLYFTFGRFCSMNANDGNFRFYGGAFSPGTGTVATTIRFEDVPCAGFADTPYATPCCVVVACSAANAGPGPPFGNGGCQGLSRTQIWYTQLNPVYRGGCISPNIPLALDRTGSVNTVRCTFNGAPRTQTLTIANPNNARITLFPTDGPSCQLLPWDPSFQYRQEFAVESVANPVVLASVPCRQSPCCTVIKCNTENIATGCPGLVASGDFPVVPPSPSGSASPSSTPNAIASPPIVSACGASNLVAPVLPPGSQFSASCSVRAPLNSHDIEVTNFNNARLLLWFTDGPFCSMSPFDASFQDYVIYRKETTALQVSAFGVPCIREPCCAIIGCGLNQAACSHVQFSSNFNGPTDSNSPSPTPSLTESPGASVTPTPTSTDSNSPSPTLSLTGSPGASVSPTPSLSDPPAPTQSTPFSTPTATALSASPAARMPCSSADVPLNLGRGLSTAVTCALTAGTASVSISNPDANSVSVFFPSGQFCSTSPSDTSFRSRPNFDTLFAFDSLVTASAPCISPGPCCFILRCDGINGAGCPSLKVSAEFSSPPQQPVPAASALSTGEIAAIGTGSALILAIAAALAIWKLGGFACMAAKAATPSDTSVTPNPLNLQQNVQQYPANGWVQGAASVGDWKPTAPPQ